jgi:dTDP-4-amino-4,6-dideoxygalactose transaminase
VLPHLPRGQEKHLQPAQQASWSVAERKLMWELAPEEEARLVRVSWNHQPSAKEPVVRNCGPKCGAPPVAEQACREVLSLPLWPYTPEAAVEEVAARVREFYSAARSPAAARRTLPA